MSEKEPHRPREDPVPEIEEYGRPPSVLTDTHVETSSVERPNEQYRNIYGSAMETGTALPGGNAVYNAKSQLLNEALMDIGMGRYQWCLTLVTGLGWFLDSFWMTSFEFIQPAIKHEATFYAEHNTYLAVSQYVGLTIGSLVLPMMTDFIGRKNLFNLTLVIMGFAGLVGAGMPAFSGLCVVSFFMGIAAGGNQSIGAAILVEILPSSHQYLLTMQGIFSALGKLLSAAFALPLMSQFACPANATERSCHYVMNMGWRYSWWTLGTITLFLCLLRFCFHLHETPKYLLAQGRDAEVVKTVRSLAVYSSKRTWLSVTHLRKIEEDLEDSAPEVPETGGFVALQQSLHAFTPTWIKSLLSPTHAARRTTALLVIIWAALGLSLPLFEAFIARYLSAARALTVAQDYAAANPWTYKIYMFRALAALPGPLAAGLAIDAPQLGRRRVAALSCVGAAVFLFAYAGAARSLAGVIAFSCVAAFFQNAAVSLLFAYTAEAFAAPVRGTALGLAGCAFRLFGLVAAIVAAFTTAASAVPVWIAAALWVVAGAVWVVLPIETRAKAAA
ncbi:major facilitator superfamily domain-containing protein [Phyllosticta citribraziliensis]|uniref:Major facilitator superfamily domain-containing protein n=1 Tax=Phyllosticta citribraziliensis TaxID=989973 RepID=A0ABR1LAI0_9PEZI